MVKDIKVTLDESMYTEFKIHYPLALNDSERIRMGLNDALEQKRLSVIEAIDFDSQNTGIQTVLSQLQNISHDIENPDD